MPSRPRLRAGLAALVAGAAVMLLWPPAAMSPGQPCQAAVALYRAVAAPGGRLRPPLADGYEVGLEQATYGPATGLAVPWDRVQAWTAARPLQVVLACTSAGGYTFAALGLRGGYAYVLLTPDGALAKLYLSSQPLTWD
jgi:hypothetical protein